ncbi:porin family protein [Roseiarcaceae bacterium H3SJ34-1]|uniref:outer membrane protein n=1 Tax=Terripilifer ovatus TaxID=3032367 RepID=UPI003AB93167|nr:porin family protein [Roseiarcaceae bacterium H3SJ34-1]
MRKVSLALAALLGTTALAAAADLPSRGYAPAPVYAAPIFTWTGFYIGVNAGYAGDKYEYPFAGFGIAGSAKLNSSGFIGGGQIGYNYQFAGSAIVVGLEADLQYTNIEGKLSLAVPPFLALTAGSQMDYLGTVRARLGYAFMDRALLYVTGGYAYGKVKSSININGFGLGTSSTNGGWTAGVGLEYALTPNWSFKTEYLYADLGNKNIITVPGFSLGVKSTAHIVRAGLNYRFNWGAPAAVVAKY